MNNEDEKQFRIVYQNQDVIIAFRITEEEE